MKITLKTVLAAWLLTTLLLSSSEAGKFGSLHSNTVLPKTSSSLNRNFTQKNVSANKLSNFAPNQAMKNSSSVKKFTPVQSNKFVQPFKSGQVNKTMNPVSQKVLGGPLNGTTPKIGNALPKNLKTIGNGNLKDRTHSPGIGKIPGIVLQPRDQGAGNGKSPFNPFPGGKLPVDPGNSSGNPIIKLPGGKLPINPISGGGKSPINPFPGGKLPINPGTGGGKPPFNPFPGGKLPIDPGTGGGKPPFNPFPGGKLPIDPGTGGGKPPFNPFPGGNPPIDPGTGGGGNNPPMDPDPQDPPYCPPKCPPWYCPPGYWPNPICLPPIYLYPPVCYNTCVTTVCPNVIVDQTVVVEQPVAEAPVEPMMQLLVGKPNSLTAEGLGDVAGSVAIEVGAIGLPTQVRSWTDKMLVIDVPFVGLNGPTPAKLHLFDSNGKPLASIPVELIVPVATMPAEVTE